MVRKFLMPLHKYFVVMVLVSSLETQEYYIDPLHSSVGFSIQYLSISDSIGVFEDFSGELFFKNKNILKLKGSVNIDSINTFNKARDEDLQNTKYFSNKKATLESIEFKNNKLITMLNINGISKKISFDVSINGPIINPSNKINILNNDLLGDINLPSELNSEVCGCYVSYGDNILGIKLVGVINRFDFNIASSTPSSLLGKYVTITIIITASR